MKFMTLQPWNLDAADKQAFNKAGFKVQLQTNEGSSTITATGFRNGNILRVGFGENLVELSKWAEGFFLEAIGILLEEAKTPVWKEQAKPTLPIDPSKEARRLRFARQPECVDIDDFNNPTFSDDPDDFAVFNPASANWK